MENSIFEKKNDGCWKRFVNKYEKYSAYKIKTDVFVEKKVEKSYAVGICGTIILIFVVFFLLYNQFKNCGGIIMINEYDVNVENMFANNHNP